VQWLHLHPQGGEKNRRNLQRKFASATPAHQVQSQAEQESIFSGHFLLGGGDLEVLEWFSFRPSFEDDDYKKVINFFEEKSAPQTKSWLRLCWCQGGIPANGHPSQY